MKKFVPEIGFDLPFYYKYGKGTGGFGSYYYVFPINLIVRLKEYAKKKKKAYRG